MFDKTILNTTVYSDSSEEAWRKFRYRLNTIVDLVLTPFWVVQNVLHNRQIARFVKASKF